MRRMQRLHIAMRHNRPSPFHLEDAPASCNVSPDCDVTSYPAEDLLCLSCSCAFCKQGSARTRGRLNKLTTDSNARTMGATICPPIPFSVLNKGHSLSSSVLA